MGRHRGLHLLYRHKQGKALDTAEKTGAPIRSPGLYPALRVLAIVILVDSLEQISVREPSLEFSRQGFTLALSDPHKRGVSASVRATLSQGEPVSLGYSPVP